MRDLFLRWADTSKAHVTGVTGVTAPAMPASSTRVTRRPEARVTNERPEETKSDKDFSNLSHVSHVSRVNGCCSVADCLELLDAMHAEIWAAYVQGALPWAMANLPELACRFYDTEAAIDRLAGTGPTEAEFQQALAAHAGVWRELVARYRAHQEQQAERADPMPELPATRCWRSA